MFPGGLFGDIPQYGSASASGAGRGHYFFWAPVQGRLTDISGGHPAALIIIQKILEIPQRLFILTQSKSRESIYETSPFFLSRVIRHSYWL